LLISLAVLRADFAALLNILWRSYPRHIQLAGGQRDKVAEHLPAAQAAGGIPEHADKLAAGWSIVIIRCSIGCAFTMGNTGLAGVMRLLSPDQRSWQN
jgi:hypothetical protein